MHPGTASYRQPKITSNTRKNAAMVANVIGQLTVMK